MSKKATQLGTGPSAEQDTRVRVRDGAPEEPSGPAPCAVCGDPFSGPFCWRDGTLRAPFVIADRYRVDEPIGGGGMALVFGGWHLGLDKPIALKLLRAATTGGGAQAQRFLREARLSAQLRHENIVSVLDVGDWEEGPAPYLVMERVHGRTLHDLMTAGTVAAPRALELLRQLVHALCAAHERGVVHRDVTPKNVMVEPQPDGTERVRLCDFGLSRSLESDDRVTTTGQIVGTPAYMAPEQLNAEDCRDAAVDVYAFATVAYELLVGDLPYPSSSPIALIASKLRDPPRPFPASSGLPGPLRETLLACLDVSPARRPSLETVADVLEDDGNRAISLAPRTDGADDTDSADRVLVGHNVGGYRVEALIGAGGMGAVYRARQEDIDAEVAIKVLRSEVARVPGAASRFLREARTTSRLESPYLPRVFGFGRLADGRPYAVMEHLEGETVAARLARDGPFSLDVTVRLLGAVSEALQVAHEAGVTHRDVKPENLLLVHGEIDGGSIRLLDFGIAFVAEDGTSALTQERAFLGTPAYAAPEQVFGEPVGPHTDVYALGATAFEMLAGVPPFSGDLSDVFAAKALPAPSIRALRPELPAAVGETLSAAMAPRISDRTPSMRAFADSLAVWKGGASDSSSDETQVSSHETTTTSRRRSRIALWLGGVVTIAAVAAGLTLMEASLRRPAARSPSSPSPSGAADEAEVAHPGADVAGPVPQQRPPAARPAPAVGAGAPPSLPALDDRPPAPAQANESIGDERSALPAPTAGRRPGRPSVPQAGAAPRAPRRRGEPSGATPAGMITPQSDDVREEGVVIVDPFAP